MPKWLIRVTDTHTTAGFFPILVDGLVLMSSPARPWAFLPEPRQIDFHRHHGGCLTIKITCIRCRNLTMGAQPPQNMALSSTERWIDKGRLTNEQRSCLNKTGNQINQTNNRKKIMQGENSSIYWLTYIRKQKLAGLTMLHAKIRPIMMTLLTTSGMGH